MKRQLNQVLKSDIETDIYSHARRIPTELIVFHETTHPQASSVLFL